jgi:hypothetical protein
VLASHLNDDRRTVRRWVIEAFQFTLPRQLGIPRLQAVAGTLKYADTRKDVETTLQRLQKPGAEDE